jgi:hypothetical protein
MDAGRLSHHGADLTSDALALPASLVAPTHAYGEYSHRGWATFCALLLNTAVVMLATYGAWSLAGVVIDRLSR